MKLDNSQVWELNWGGVTGREGLLSSGEGRISTIKPQKVIFRPYRGRGSQYPFVTDAMQLLLSINRAGKALGHKDIASQCGTLVMLLM